MPIVLTPESLAALAKPGLFGDKFLSSLNDGLNRLIQQAATRPDAFVVGVALTVVLEDNEHPFTVTTGNALVIRGCGDDPDHNLKHNIMFCEDVITAMQSTIEDQSALLAESEAMGPGPKERQ